MDIGQSVGRKITVVNEIIFPFNYNSRYKISANAIVNDADRLTWDSVVESIDPIIIMIDDYYEYR